MMMSKFLKLQTARQLVWCLENRPVSRFKHTHPGLYREAHPYNVDRLRNLQNQSTLLPGPERIRASQLVDNPENIVSEVPYENISVVYDVLQSGLKVSNDGDCLGTRTEKPGVYKWMKYSEVILRSQYVGSGLIHLGLEPRKETLVGVVASNRVEYSLTLWACTGYSFVLVPVYDSLGTGNICRIIDEGKHKVFIADNEKNTLFVLNSAKQFPFLKTLVCMDPVSDEVMSLSKKNGVQTLTFDELQELGKKNLKEPILPNPEDLLCITYTSGTTGVPKGVMLTQKNMVACLSSLKLGYGPAGAFGGTFFSYFPPAHVYEMINMIASMYFARRTALYNGDIKNLFTEIQALKPTHLPLVPKLMNAFYAKVTEEVRSSKLKHFLFNLAMSRKEKLLRKGILRNDTIWDKFVLKKIQNALGGNMFASVTTSAPISKEVMVLFRCASASYMFEAYGQTEILGSVMTLPFETSGGFVGPPLPCNHIKLIDVPDMNYFSKNDEGEVCIKGANVFKGYFMNPEATKECMDDEGWHHTGDIGRWLPNGTLQIIDRKKHLFKLAQGEYIAPEKVENAYSRCSLVQQIFVDGHSDKEFVVVIVCPEPSTFSLWLKKQGFTMKEEELTLSKELRAAFLTELHKFGKEGGLTSLEQAKNLHLYIEPLTLESGLLTPTLKLRRNKARSHFQQIVIKLYQEGQIINYKQ